LDVKEAKIHEGDSIRRDNMFLTFKGFDSNNGQLIFDMENAETKLKEEIQMNIKYWESSINYAKDPPYETFANGGVYSFIPKDG